MTNKTASKTYFTYNFFEHTINGTKASFNKANKGFGPEYEALTRMMAAQPTFTLVIKEQKAKSTKAKRSYEGLDFQFMENYIKTLDDSDLLSKNYEAIKKQAQELKRSVFPYTKAWFIEKFGTKEDGFDMDAAKERVKNYFYAQAEKQASNPNEKSNEQNEVKQNTNVPSLISTLADTQVLAAD